MAGQLPRMGRESPSPGAVRPYAHLTPAGYPYDLDTP
jgi:hypothetical protein